MHGKIQNAIVKPVVSRPSMQSLDVLLQLLQPEIASTRSWLPTTTSLATFVPGADRLANAATASLGAVATMRDGLCSGSCMCAMYNTDACVCMSSYLHPARLTNTSMALGNGKHRTQLLGANYRLGALRLEDGLRAGGVRRPHCTARCTW